MACPKWLCPCFSASAKTQEESKPSSPTRAGTPERKGSASGSANGADDLLFKKSVKLVSNNTGSPGIQPRTAAPEKIEPKKTTTKPTSTRGFGSAISAGLAALWNALEKGDENEFLDQSAVIERALPALRAGSKTGPDVTSAMSLATAAGVPTDASVWGKDIAPPDARYSGPHIRWPLTLTNAREVLRHIRTRPEIPLHPKYLAELLAKSVVLLKEEVRASVFEMSVPPGGPGREGKLVVCGDTHGHLEDFLYVLSENGEPSEDTWYLMNGDLVDRGPFGSEILIVLLLFKQLFPKAVVINRGNHENLQINRRRSEDGGGFYDEVMSKYAETSSDQGIFFMFQQLFEYLPLATLVAGRMFVIHGGLFRHECILLNDIRKINRRRQCPTTTADRDDSIMFDSMWSDPQDTNGVSPSHRGSNCIRFGPDVTERFARNNGLALVVRSHELPPSNRGFESGHGGKLATLFTASDYCGCTGNTGAIMIVRPDLTYVVREHVAWMKDPDEMFSSSRVNVIGFVECFAGEEIVGGGSSGDLGGVAVGGGARPASRGGMLGGGSQRLASGVAVDAEVAAAGGGGGAKADRRASEAQRDVLAKVRAGLSAHRDALFKYWSKLDEDGSGEITVDQWRDGVCVVLDLPDSLPWNQLQGLILGPLASSGAPIRYVEYLHESLPPPLARTSSMGGRNASVLLSDDFRRQVVNKFFETVICKDLSLRETLSTFDQDGDGFVTADELRRYLNEVHSDLPEVQVDAILRAMHYRPGDFRRAGSSGSGSGPAGGGGAASVQSAGFRRTPSAGSASGGGGERFSLDDFLGRFRVIYREGTAGRLSEEQLADLGEIGRHLLGRDSRLDVFQRIDTSGNGYVEAAEFQAALAQLPGLGRLVGRQDLWEAVDINGDGRLNLVEFCASFEVAHTEESEHMAEEIWRSILLSLHRNSVSLDFVWRYFDPCNAGRISATDFKAGFVALNRSLQGGGLLTDDQLDVVIRFLDRNGDGMIDREEWAAVYQ